MKIEINMNDKEVKEAAGGGDFEPLPDGQYEVSCQATELTVTGPDSKTPGTPMIKWTFDVINNPDYAGRRLWSYTVINPDAEDNFSLANHLEALVLTVGKDGSFESDDVLGRNCIANVTQSMFNNKITNNVKSLIAN